VLVTTEVTLTQVFMVDGVPTDCTGPVTVTVKRLDGTEIAGSPFTASHPGVGTYTFPFTEQAQVDMFSGDWSGNLAGAVVVLRDYIEVVGGFYFGLAEARTALKAAIMRDPQTYTDAYLTQARTGIEQECDLISGQAWVPRYARFLLNGTGTNELVVPDMNLRTVRAASVAPSAAGPFTALTVDELAACAAEPSGIIARDDGAVWPLGHRNVIVEYEHGADMPTVEVHNGALARLRTFTNLINPSLPDRVLIYTTNEGATYRLTAAGPKSTGIDTIDAAYRRDTVDKFWLAR